MSGVTIKTDNFPHIYIKIDHINNDDDYYSFENTWLDLYNEKKEFIFVINIKDIGNVNIIYVYKLIQLIRLLKREEKQYLKYSIIIVNTNFIKHLLNIIFRITPPVAPVYIVDKAEYYRDLIIDIKNKKDLKPSIKYISP